MAGLLDALNTYEGQQGLGLLAAAGPRFDGAGFFQRLQEGMGSADKWKREQSKAELEKLQLEAEKAKIEDYKRKTAQEQSMRELVSKFAVPAQQGIAPLVGNPELGILPSQGMPAKPAGFDYKGYATALAGIDPIEALKIQKSLQGENQINKLDVKDFTPASVAKFAQTNNYGDLVRLDKAHFANTGGQTVALDAFTGKPLNTIDNTQSPDSKASNAISWANYGLSKDRLNFDKQGGADAGKPSWDAASGSFIYKPTFDNPQGRVVKAAGFEKPLGETAKKTLSGVESLNGAISEYLTELKGWGTTDAVRPDKRASMGTKYNNMMLQAKEAYNLGVLNGPDYQILQSVVTDPASLTGFITSNQALGNQAQELSRIMSKITAPAVRDSGAKAESTQAKPTGKAPMLGQVVDGYKFKGGNPADKANWEKQ